MDEFFSESFLTVQEILLRHDPESYLVGGCLRDAILGRPTRDADFALSQNPKAAAERAARRLKAPLVELEEERQIYRLIAPDGMQFDFARFKGANLQEDLSLRDFTVNAMAARLPVRDSRALSENLIDPFGGRRDLRDRVIRQVSAAVYEDDPLRLLRAFRIAAQLGFQIDPATEAAIRANAGKIRGPAPERVREELLQILEVPYAHPFVLRLDEAGLISPLFPEVDANRTCALDYYPGKGVWGHSLDGLRRLEWIFKNLAREFPEDHAKMAPVLFEKGDDTEGHSRAALLKLGVLFHDLGKASTARVVEGRLRFFMHDDVGARMTRGIAQRLKFSTRAGEGLSTLVQWHMRPGGLAHIPDLSERAKYRFFRELGPLAVPMMIVSLADRYTYLTDEEMGKGTDLHEKSTKEILRWYYRKELEQAARKPKLINGNVLMERFHLEPSPLIGRILRDADEAAALGEIRTPAEALEFARDWLERSPGGALSDDKTRES